MGPRLPHDRGSRSRGRDFCAQPTPSILIMSPLGLRAACSLGQIRKFQEKALTRAHRACSAWVHPIVHCCVGACASAAAHLLTIENLSRSQIRSREKVFEIPVGWICVLERTAGWMNVNAALRSGLEQAYRAGADLRTGTASRSWSWTGNKFAVRTSAGTFMAAHLIVTGGALSVGS